jgi:hypothetical protein
MANPSWYTRFLAFFPNAFEWIINSFFRLLLILGTTVTTVQQLAGKQDIVAYLQTPGQGHISAGALLAMIAGALGEFYGSFKFNELKRQSEELKRAKLKIEQATREIEKLRIIYTEIFESEIQILFGYLSLGSTERISIYKFTKINNDEKFFLLARYSINPEFKKIGRSFYPVDQGCIAEAWQHGKSSMSLTDPKKDEPKYFGEQVSYGVPIEVAHEFKMKAATYVGLSLQNHIANSRKAIIIFESTKAKQNKPNAPLDPLKIKAEIDSDRCRVLKFLENLEDFEPDPNLATESGF